ncbi:hypothetical protein QYM36_008511, partial [Artemia franciscana]
MTVRDGTTVSWKIEGITLLNRRFATISEMIPETTAVLQSAEDTDFKNYLPPSNGLSIFLSPVLAAELSAAYRLWTCSMFLPYWADAVPVKPCRSFCHQVERLCPYFLPADKTGPGSQYAGEPSYMCIGLDLNRSQKPPLIVSWIQKDSMHQPYTVHEKKIFIMYIWATFVETV